MAEGLLEGRKALVTVARKGLARAWLKRSPRRGRGS